MTVRKIRRSQIISPFGPGAIIDLVGESFVVEDAGRWPGPHVPIDFPRLAAYLKVDSLQSPSPRRAIPYFRFPQWLFCRKCRRMTKWRQAKEIANTAPSCEHCLGSVQLIPMRFVAVCANGHLSDVDWVRWAHSGIRRNRNQGQCQKPDLRFESKGNVGGGLNSLVVHCTTCQGERSLEGLTTRIGLRQLGISCTGKQPWQEHREAESCSEAVVAMQRGASSVYFPGVESAIDIPPESAWSYVSDPLTALQQNSEFKFLTKEPPGHPLTAAMIKIAASKTGLSSSAVEAALARATADPHGSTDGGPENIRPDEWSALINPVSSDNAQDFFITRRADQPLHNNEAAVQWSYAIADVILVDRLREVRVLTHFERHTMQRKIRSNLSPDNDFLPAIEVFGEGFFLKFDEDAISRWEQRDIVIDRCRPLQERYRLRGPAWLPAPTPRFVLLHTFAHLLLRNTAFEAGYSTSALRERLYVTSDESEGPTMAGVLIYTAAGDSEGTLGGLVRMGEYPRLGRLLDMSINAAQWCSFDPVCAEHPGQGPDGLSRAACHACSLVPETSCEASNRLLDRRLLIDPEFGFFADIATAVGGVPGISR